ncbi:hypothetical protein MGYG_00733 [Nannizzia gypsea CBS 118893]|uniref:Uncharacterized protein n=1 Tax=Arthroderma gypseum (strain ATCC MYA-4604 / CBS 118893) TaxID=535722 RepID=E5R1E3_ARTGP|nr:hypothetical protein MGYG_00733 [Nannizzia gypsea CBS 118893]EFQ97694.1 hypothetical protein MGYG_00733 [Nannizzia gypsea CBS 118893]
MKIYLLLAALFPLLYGVDARQFIYRNVTIAHCPAPDGEFCYEDRNGPMVIKCVKNSIVGTINCKKHKGDQNAMCFESSETAGDATCLHRGTGLMSPAVEKDSSTPMPYVKSPRSLIGTQPVASTFFGIKEPATTPQSLPTELVVSTLVSIPQFTRSSGMTWTPAGKVAQSSAQLRTESVASTFAPDSQVGMSVILSGLPIESTTTLSATTTTTDVVLTSLWTSARTREIPSFVTPEPLVSYPTSEVTTKHEEVRLSSTHCSATIQPTSVPSTFTASLPSASTTTTSWSSDVVTLEPTVTNNTTVSSTSTTTTTMFITFMSPATTPAITTAITTAMTETKITEQPQQGPTTESKEVTQTSVTLSPSTIQSTSIVIYTSHATSSASMLPTQFTQLTSSEVVTASVSFTSTTLTVRTNSTFVHSTPTYSIATSTIVNAAEENTTDAKLAYLFGLIVAFLVLV